jgi:hypothetical protein
LLNDVRESIDATHRHFSSIFIGGIPRLLNSDGAYLSFIAIFAGTESLAGFRYRDDGNGPRFRRFVAQYYESRYEPLAGKLWDLRNSMTHSFAPRHFLLTHHQSHRHFAAQPPFVAVLNAEDVYAAFVTATEGYFRDLLGDTTLQDIFMQRLGDEGQISVS